MARTGRRPGNQDTRVAILEAARKAFGERGYDGTSIRAIATSAGVDPALVHHYFGTKDQLFVAVVQFPLSPEDILPRVFQGDWNQVGERVVRTVLAIWDSPAGTSAAAMLRSAIQQDWMARILREFLMTQVVRRVGAMASLPPDELAIRAPLVISQVVGLIVTRYLIRVEPLASMPPQQVVALIGPTIQRYVSGPLPLAPEAGNGTGTP